jgi:hypothetical protein
MKDSDDFNYLRSRIDSIFDIVNRLDSKGDEQDRRIEKVENEIPPIKSSIDMVKGALKLLGLLIALVGAAHFVVPPQNSNMTKQTPVNLQR